MKKLTACILLFVLFSTVSHAQTNTKMLRHVVLFGWKAGADSAAISKAVDAFRALPQKIDLIKQFEWGTNNSPENLNQGLTHCFLVTFANEKDRDAYLVHPAHKAFVAAVGSLIDKVTVVDYWTQQ